MHQRWIKLKQQNLFKATRLKVRDKVVCTMYMLHHGCSKPGSI